MVSRGSRPEHRRGTTGRPWIRFRKRHVTPATHCQRPTCGRPLVRDAACEHPSHAKLKGCPTHPGYPTLEHPASLVNGGQVRDDKNAAVWCFHCNSSEGASLRRGRQSRGTPVPPPLDW